MYDHVVTSTENHLEIPPDNFKLIFLPIHNPLLGQESFDFSESLMVIVNMLERPTGCGGVVLSGETRNRSDERVKILLSF